MTRSGIIKTVMTVIVLSVALTGCKKTEFSNDGSLQKVLDKGELVLGLDENFPPMGFRDENGEITGFDVDLAKEVCDRLGIKLTCHPIDWDKKEELLYAGEIDCIWNGMSVTEERKKNMLLSDPYVENELVFTVKRNSEIKRPDDLKGKKVGVQLGSSAYDELQEAPFYDDIDPVPMEDNVVLLDELKNGDIDAVLIDSIVIYYIAKQSDDYVLLRQSLSDEDMAIGFRKGDESLRDKVQEVLSEMKSDGTLAGISAEWFGSDITIVR